MNKVYCYIVLIFPQPLRTTKQENNRHPRNYEGSEKNETLIVLTDKTNYTRLVLIVDYQIWVNDYLLKAADLAFLLKVIGLFDESNKLI